jgi:hypothetical protein
VQRQQEETTPAPTEDKTSETVSPSTRENMIEVARGRNPWTPFLIIGSVAITVWLIAGVITAAVILLWIFL